VPDQPEAVKEDVPRINPGASQIRSAAAFIVAAGAVAVFSISNSVGWFVTAFLPGFRVIAKEYHPWLNGTSVEGAFQLDYLDYRAICLLTRVPQLAQQFRSARSRSKEPHDYCGKPVL